MNKNKKILSVLIILVILLSHSIIPVSASSDYYSSTYNGFNYDCRSEFTSSSGAYGEMSYAGISRICVEVEYELYNFYYQVYATGSVTSTFVRSYAYAGVAGNIYQLFEWFNHTYSISFNTVYFVGLSQEQI